MGDRMSVGNDTTQTSSRYNASNVPNRGMGTYSVKKGVRAIRKPYTLDEDFQDHQDVEMQARLYEESVGYRNLANNRQIVERAQSAVMAGLKDVYNVMEFLRQKWLILYRLYRGEPMVEFQYGRPNLHSPEPFKIVETMHPRLMRSLFGNNAWFRLYGENEGYDSAAMAQELLTKQQFRDMHFKSKASSFIRDGLIYGTAVQKCYWDQKSDEVVYRTGKRVPNPNFPGASKVELEEVKKQEIIFDGNKVENVSIFDFWTSPNSSCIEDAEWCADRSAWPDYKIKQMGEYGHWLNLDALKNFAGTNDMSFGDEFKERKSYSYGVFDPREASWAPHIPHYTVVDWWGPLVIEDNNGNLVTKQCNVVMIEPDSLKLVVRITENPFWHKKKPYQAWRPIHLEDEFYGIGALEMIARLSMEKDTKRNVLMAATQLEANPMWLVADDANIPDGQLLAQPGLCLRVPDIQNSIAPLHVPSVSDAALKAENILTKDIRETAGTTSPTMAASDPFGKSKTATQHTSEIDEANTRLSGLVENYELEVIEPMLHQMTWNNQQFCSYEKVIREVGPAGLRYQDRYTIRPEDLLGRFIVQPLVSHRLKQKMTQIQQLTNLLDRAPIINQMYGPQAVKMPKLMATILEDGFDIKNVEDYISVPPDEAGLLTAIEEHELWYHGQVPPRRADDNDMRHVLAHSEEVRSERFALLEEKSPGTAARARAHIADHMRKIALLQENQEDMMMQMAQLATMQGMSPGAPAGAAAPGQEPQSPQVRRNENQRGEGQGGGQNEVKAEATRNSPNVGAS